MLPREIPIFPPDAVFDGEREINERTVLRPWLQQWLKWVSWYHTFSLQWGHLLSMISLRLLSVLLHGRAKRRTLIGSNSDFYRRHMIWELSGISVPVPLFWWIVALFLLINGSQSEKAGPTSYWLLMIYRHNELTLSGT
jgi:hypothetical protein